MPPINPLAEWFALRVALVLPWLLGTCHLLSTNVIGVNGVPRTYELHAPATLDPGVPAPLVIALHQFTATGRQMREMTGFDAIADREGFIVAYPDGLERSWNYDLSGVTASLKITDDETFILRLIDRLERDFNVDPRRIYLVGASNGAMFAQSMACLHAGRFAAIAAVMGSIEEATTARCRPDAPMPVVLVHGDQDMVVPYEGGLREEVIRHPVYLSAPENAAWWAGHNGCTDGPRVFRLPLRDPPDGTRAILTRYGGCDGGARVFLYTIQGGGHTWPGSAQRSSGVVVGRVSNQLAASEAIWDFLREHVRD